MTLVTGAGTWYGVSAVVSGVIVPPLSVEGGGILPYSVTGQQFTKNQDAHLYSVSHEEILMPKLESQYGALWSTSIITS